MSLENLQPSAGSTKNRKKVGRGQRSGWGCTSGKGNKGQKSRSGYNHKRNFEGGQQPLAKRLPKVGFTSKVQKPYVINVEKITAVAQLSEISLESIKTVHKIASGVETVKLIGRSAKELASKITDKSVTFTGK